MPPSRQPGHLIDIETRGFPFPSCGGFGFSWEYILNILYNYCQEIFTYIKLFLEMVLRAIKAKEDILAQFFAKDGMVGGVKAEKVDCRDLLFMRCQIRKNQYSLWSSYLHLLG
jgi:hypothetical protein